MMDIVNSLVEADFFSYFYPLWQKKQNLLKKEKIKSQLIDY